MQNFVIIKDIFSDHEKVSQDTIDNGRFDLDEQNGQVIIREYDKSKQSLTTSSSKIITHNDFFIFRVKLDQNHNTYNLYCFHKKNKNFYIIAKDFEE